MKQLLHLLIVNRDRRQGLASTHGLRWLLPIACCTDRTRAGPLAARWLAGHSLPGHVIGQWLGRVTPADDAMDWLVVVDAVPVAPYAAPGGMRWMPLEDLRSSASVLDYQQWALRKAIPHELPSVPGAFGSMNWSDAVRDWVSTVAGPLAGPPICYKATPREVVLGIAAASGTVYFKGLTGERVAEATLTSMLSDELPESFAQTLAFERRADGAAWWLTAHCAGTTLAADPTPERAALVAVNLGRIQQRVRTRAAGFPILEADLPGATAWTCALLAEHSGVEQLERHRIALGQLCQTVHDADLPQSWIPLDLDPGNVLIDDAVVRFVDLDQSRIGSAPLSLAQLLRRLKRMRTWSASPEWIEVVRAYEQSWTPQLALRGVWPALEIASLLLETHLSWQQLSGNAAQGDVYGALDLAAASTAQRLARALDRICGDASAQGS